MIFIFQVGEGPGLDPGHAGEFLSAVKLSEHQASPSYLSLTLFVIEIELEVVAGEREV